MDYDDEFPTCIATFASLRVFSDDIEPAAITTLLGVAPSRTFKRGDSHGNRGFVRKFNGWFLDSEGIVKSKDTRRHVDWILSQVGDKGEQFERLKSKGVEIDISCLWVSTGQGGPILSPPQMKRLQSLNIDIWWDVYFRAEAYRS